MRSAAVALVAAALLAGCDHSEPFPPQQPANAPPRGMGNPIRVTYNVGTDLRPTWLPDGSGFFYTQERADRADEDRCFARMTSGGGSVLEEICDRSATTDDSIATFEWAAVDPNDRMAYLRAGTPVTPPTLAARTLELRLGTRAAPAGVLVKSFPYAAASGSTHWTFSFLQWDAAQLLYLAENLQYIPPCSGCFPDTLRTGIEVVTIDPASGAMEIMPGTTGATGVALAGSDAVYYTLDTSAVIWRRERLSGSVTPLYVVGAGARGVSAGGTRLAVVTGEGFLWLVNSGVVTQLFAPVLTFFERPALAPDGGALVVEGYAFQVDTVRFQGMIVAIDTLVSTSSDLWFFDLP